MPRVIGLFVVVAFFCTIALDGARAQPAWQDEWEKTLAAAKKEGKAVVGVPPSSELRKELESVFKARFGFELELFPATGPQIANRVVTEGKAGAEIAIEGEVPPPKVESRAEGPFGEWPGYYSGGTVGTGEAQPVIKVKAIYHRNDPILEEEAPLWTGAMKIDGNPSAGILWDQLESAGIQNVVGVYNHSPYLTVVAIQ
jgi:hypothetical protein